MDYADTSHAQYDTIKIQEMVVFVCIVPTVLGVANKEPSLSARKIQGSFRPITRMKVWTKTNFDGEDLLDVHGRLSYCK